MTPEGTERWNSRFEFWKSCTPALASKQFELIMSENGPWPGDSNYPLNRRNSQ